MNQKVENIMTKDIVWIYPTQSLFEAFQVMRQFDIRHLPVVEGKENKLVGLLSEGDIILFCQKQGKRLKVDSQLKVREAMSKEVVYCYPSSKSADVAATMIAAKIDSMPVLEPITKKIIGIVTTTDLLDEICTREEMDGQKVRPLTYGNPNSRLHSNVEKLG